MAVFTALSHRQRQLIEKIAGDRYQPFVRLYQAWPGIVGELLATRSHPFRFAHQILYIAVQNNAWLQELYLRKTDILRQCRAAISTEIKDLIFFIHR